MCLLGLWERTHLTNPADSCCSYPVEIQALYKGVSGAQEAKVHLQNKSIVSYSYSHSASFMPKGRIMCTAWRERESTSKSLAIEKKKAERKKDRN